MGRPQKSPITFGNDLKCGHCGKYYESRQSMRSHLIRHGQRAFKCEICSESYHTKRELQRHSVHHYQKHRKCFTCIAVSCESKFDKVYKLQLHLKNDHNMSKTNYIQCKKCDFHFACPKSFNYHYVLYHSDININSAHLPKIKRDSPVKDENQSPKSESSKVSIDRSPRSVPAARQTYQPGMFMPYLALMQVPVESSAEQIGYPRISVTRNDEQCTRGSITRFRIPPTFNLIPFIPLVIPDFPIRQTHFTNPANLSQLILNVFLTELLNSLHR
ncbi:hypothetical protein L5515_017584 [Caenorhabditis briggsae]|uniref:C2H2-type domain-containing protein n=1 Tax=Caenorhabditis briggsae TaxID=6238 RepID=A0AAE9F8Z7_CAEBR|nr:hypothetical protein L5515_017584 [Caenorhabditis briggsae]